MGFVERVDARRVLCYHITNVEQDHDLGSAGCGPGCGSGAHFCAVVHPRPCTDSKGVPARVLRE